MVTDRGFHDNAGIHVEFTYGQLRRAYSKLELAVGEGQYRFFPPDAGLSFCLALDSETELALDKVNGDLSRIPDRTEVNYILVFGKRPGHIGVGPFRAAALDNCYTEQIVLFIRPISARYIVMSSESLKTTHHHSAQ